MPTYSELLTEYREALREIRRLATQMRIDGDPKHVYDIMNLCDELLNKARKKPTA